MRKDQFSSGSPGTLTTITETETDRLTGRVLDVTSPAYIPGPLPEPWISMNPFNACLRKQPTCSEP